MGMAVLFKIETCNENQTKLSLAQSSISSISDSSHYKKRKMVAVTLPFVILVMADIQNGHQRFLYPRITMFGSTLLREGWISTRVDSVSPRVNSNESPK